MVGVGESGAEQGTPNISLPAFPRATESRSPPFVVHCSRSRSDPLSRTTTTWSRLYSALTFRRVLGAADRIIAPSQDTVDDLNALVGVTADKIRVIPNGVDERFFSRPPNSADRAGPYVLFVGTPEPRKNLARLVSAMTLLRSRGFRERLVIVGGSGWGDAVPSHDRVVIGGFRRYLHLYTRTPPVGPPLSSRGIRPAPPGGVASGAPVVAARSGALPEVTGGAAVLVDPLNPVAIADGISEALSRRDSLVERGRIRAREFSWGKTAGLTAEVYKELV